VTVKWIDNAPDEYAYEIQRAGDSAFTVNTQTVNGPAVTTGTGVYVDTGLTTNTSYYYRVRASNSVGPSAYSGTAGVLTFCNAPLNPAAIGGNGNVSIAWNASTGATGYTLYRALSSGNEGSTPYQTGIASTTFTDNSATNGTRYYYKVSAVNASGAGLQSAEFSAVPSATTTIDQWKLQKFGSVPAAQSPAAADLSTPAGDGISNLMKYALNLNPFSSGAAGLPRGTVETIGGTNYLTLTFQRLHPAPADISYIVETSNNLSIGTWTPAVVVGGYPLDNGNGTETMKERDALPFSSGNRFIRLRITHP
jgi:cellulose 1,4-beta-cellobiosidase